MGNYITSDKTLKVGDYVLSRYHKGDLLYRVTKITQRFLEAKDISPYAHIGANVGDEYNPYIQCEAVENISISADSKKKLRKKTIGLDAGWVTKVDPATIEAYIEKLHGILLKLF